jgi:hypothetical protein
MEEVIVALLHSFISFVKYLKYILCLDIHLFTINNAHVPRTLQKLLSVY